MKGSSFKMKGFSGFGNSPVRQEEHETKTKTETTTPISPQTNKPYPKWVMDKKSEGSEEFNPRSIAMAAYDDNQRRLADPEMQRTADMITDPEYTP